MKASLMRITVAALAVCALIAATGCVQVEIPVPEAASDSDSIDAGGATELVASVEMGAGRLAITGGASGAMDADYDFTDAEWRPEVRYDVAGGEGRLSVRTPSRPRFSITGQMRYDWRIVFTDEMPLDLSVTMGAGESDLDLGSLDLRRLQVTLGAGDATVDLVGEARHDLVADITAGAGAVTLRVPADVGVRVVGYQDGLGSYRADGFKQDGNALVNDAWDDAEVRFEITLRRGLGDVTIESVG
ncbi:MAG: hypothetical protein JXP72_10230 [Coriobacteriia bacterium]|nr:hypothetical protein [Coriobacteriia bacterium]